MYRGSTHAARGTRRRGGTSVPVGVGDRVADEGGAGGRRRSILATAPLDPATAAQGRSAMRRRNRTLWLLGALALCGGGAARHASAGSATKVADAPYPADFRGRVRKGIEQGVKHLRSGQMLKPETDATMDRIQYEEAAAVTWVLRRAGVPADDPTLVEAARRLRARSPNTIDEATLVLLALCARPLPEANPFAIAEASKPEPAPPALSTDDRTLVESTVQLVLTKQLKAGRFASAGKEYDGAGGWGTDLTPAARLLEAADIPTTYLALLGLEAAARRGVAIPASTYLAALPLLLRSQAAKGPKVTLKMNEVRGTDRFEWTESAQARGFGWTAVLANTPTGYETVGGALGLAVCQDALQKDRGFTKEIRRQTRTAIRDAFAWLQQNYDITKNPVVGREDMKELVGPLYHHHWLQGLARLEIHARMRFVGTHDWYQEGAEELLKTQDPDGSWDAIWWSNCYALLFLMRASLPSISPVVTVTEGG